RPPTSAICTSDGTWWLVEDHGRLWRVPPGGTKIEVKLDQQTRWVANDDDRVLALGQTTIYEGALDGHVRGRSEVGQAKGLGGGRVGSRRPPHVRAARGAERGVRQPGRPHDRRADRAGRPRRDRDVARSGPGRTERGPRLSPGPHQRATRAGLAARDLGRA